MTTTNLAARWRDLRATKQHLRTRDAAAELGVSEAELVDTMVGDTAVRLAIDPPALLSALTEVGDCMALTRCESAVSEVRGRYGGIELGAHAGQVVGEHIDLRVFLDHWRHAYAIDEPHPTKDGKRRRSIHVFDRAGLAVHKIYLEPEGNVATWDAYVQRATANAPGVPVFETPPPPRPERPDTEVDVEPMRVAWDAMTDTHEFFHLLANHKVSRTQALRLAGRPRARHVQNDALSLVLHDAAETGEKIMIFVGNRGCLQVFSGAVKKIVRSGPWLNVLDPGFNLHVREDHIAGSWVVAKPTSAGTVSSLELFDAAGNTIALVFRKRDDRANPEDPAWHALLDRLPEAR